MRTDETMKKATTKWDIWLKNILLRKKSEIVFIIFIYIIIIDYILHTHSLFFIFQRNHSLNYRKCAEEISK